MLFDTHAHFNSSRFKHDRDEVIQKAYESGVTLILNVSYDAPSIQHSLSLSRKYDFIYAAVGIHPHYAQQTDQQILDQMRELAKEPKVVAIGEIGLDYYRNLSPVDVQKQWFQEQIQLAREIKLPIIVHNRDAHQDIMKCLMSEDAKGVEGIIHSFSGDVEMAGKLLDHGFYLSISGPVTYKNAKQLTDVVEYVPLDRLLIETDCPYLTPHPFRGKRNDSSFVRLVAERIAEIKDVPLEEVAQTTMQNAKRLLKIDG